jgi:hypothetical protein
MATSGYSWPQCRLQCAELSNMTRTHRILSKKPPINGQNPIRIETRTQRRPVPIVVFKIRSLLVSGYGTTKQRAICEFLSLASNSHRRLLIDSHFATALGSKRRNLRVHSTWVVDVICRDSPLRRRVYGKRQSGWHGTSFNPVVAKIGCRL